MAAGGGGHTPQLGSGVQATAGVTTIYHMFEGNRATLGTMFIDRGSKQSCMHVMRRYSTPVCMTRRHKNQY